MEKILSVFKAIEGYGLFASLYFTQGVPGGFIATALLYNLYNQEGWTKTAGGKMLAMAGLPWVFKALFGPVVDRWAPLATRQRRFSWVVVSTIAMALVLLILGAVPLRDISFTGIVTIVFLHNLARSFQDVATDGLSIELLSEKERGPATTVMRASAHFGSMLGGAGGILLIGKVPWGWICALVAALVVIFGLILPGLMLKRGGFVGAANATAEVEQPNGWREFLHQFKLVVWGAGAVAAICVGLLAHTAESLTAPMLMHWFGGLGYSGNYVAFLDTAGGWAKIGGTVLGGALTAMISVRRAFALAVVFKAWAYASLGLFFAYWSSSVTVFIGLMMSSVCDGMMVVIVTVLFMGVTVRRVAASHFAVLMAAMNLSNTWASWVGGGLADSIGVRSTFIVGGVAQLLILLPFLLVRQIKEEES